MFRHQQGFNLIELMITVAVLGISLSIGLPSFSKFIASQQLTANANQLLGEINFARSTALLSATQVVLCPSATGQSCHSDSSWHRGRIVFADSNRNRKREPTEPLLQVIEATSGPITALSSRSRKLLRYQPNGFSIGTNLTIRLCHPQLAEGRKVVVSNAGRARVERISCPNG